MVAVCKEDMKNFYAAAPLSRKKLLAACCNPSSDLRPSCFFYLDNISS